MVLRKSLSCLDPKKFPALPVHLCKRISTDYMVSDHLWREIKLCPISDTDSKVVFLRVRFVFHESIETDALL